MMAEGMDEMMPAVAACATNSGASNALPAARLPTRPTTAPPIAKPSVLVLEHHRHSFRLLTACVTRNYPFVPLSFQLLLVLSHCSAIKPTKGQLDVKLRVSVGL